MNQPQFPLSPIYAINLQKNKEKQRNERSPMDTMIRSLLEIVLQNINNFIISEILKLENQNLRFEEVKKILNKNIK